MKWTCDYYVDDDDNSVLLHYPLDIWKDVEVYVLEIYKGKDKPIHEVWNDDVMVKRYGSKSFQQALRHAEQLIREKQENAI